MKCVKYVLAAKYAKIHKNACHVYKTRKYVKMGVCFAFASYVQNDWDKVNEVTGNGKIDQQ